MRSLILLFTFLFISCALDDGKLSGNLYEDDAERTGMVRIPAKDQFVLLGTNDSTAPLNDRPSMKVKFTYSFSISKNEVTRKEYIELMGGKSSSVQDSGDLPQTNVTYYDAILFANAKSVNEGYDTAYTYSSALFDSEGNCTYLEGLLFDPLTEAYRLPTEAEWVFVASHNWKPSQGWNNLNSDYRAHEVCTADTNKLSICDMAGNVMEWVNDWLGHLMDTTVTNYVGAPDGGSLGQRVVKGGSFNNALGNITLYSRGDVYTVTSSTKSDYVGFRLAFGVIPSPTWI
jgi:formylglycine-generating enzyme required for sulfatase activity